MTTDARHLRLIRLASDAIAQCPNPRPRYCDVAPAWRVPSRWHAAQHAGCVTP